MSDYFTFKLFDPEQVMAEMKRDAELQASLDPSDPQHHKMFSGVDSDGYISIFWSGHCYPFDVSDISAPEDLIWSVHHIAKKVWQHTTPKRIALLLEAVAIHKGWPMYGRVPHRNQMPPASRDTAAERAKMTPQLRYEVIRRDGHRCRCCGASVSTGAVLHIDHIIAVALGGQTAIDNLQTLCSACNQGKAAS